MKRIYLSSLTATKDEGAVVDCLPVIIFHDTEEEALAELNGMLEKHYPYAEGWRNHKTNAQDVTEYIYKKLGIK